MTQLRAHSWLGWLGALAVAACGSKVPAGAWVEHETGSREHATPVDPTADPLDGVYGEPGALPADLTTLDAAAIDKLDEATVRAALQRAGDAAPAARLALRGARLAYHRGDGAAARSLLARATSAADEANVHAELAALGAKLAEPAIDKKLVAVLLPLSGRFSPIGSELKVAIQLAAPPGVTWLFVDTRGEIDGATAAVEQAYAKGAVAILGPVGEREAIAAARAASLRGIPIALLAPSDGADAASGVFRMVDSPADEGRAIAQLAADDQFPTVAVFAPRDDVGTDAAEAFVEEATRLGVQVIQQGTYDPTGGNLEPDVKEFLNLVPARNPRFAQHLRRNGKRGWVTFTPDIAYSMLYIPDRYDRAALVAAFLPYFGVELRTTEFPDPAYLQRKHGGVMPQVVQLVGGAGWHHSTLPVRGGPAVQGALIVDTFASDLGGDTGAQFAQAFLARTGRTPTAAAAQAYDAATAIGRAQATAHASTSPDPRAAVRDALSRVTLDDGACGPAQMGGDGELHRDPLVLEVVGDALQILR